MSTTTLQVIQYNLGSSCNGLETGGGSLLFSGSSMTPNEIQSELQRLAPWFHQIDLGGGIVTKTDSLMGEPVDHPRSTWEIIGQCLPMDLTGKTVLDVGCNAGFYSVEAKRRGAERVLGVDGQRQHIRQALFVRKALGLDMEFRRINVYDLEPETVGRFDITLALGLVYHLKHLVLGLERLFEVTNELLVLESAVLPPENTPESFVQRLGSVEQTLHPVFYADNPAGGKEQVFNWFLPSLRALGALLRNVGFADINVFSVLGDRAVLVCRKSRHGTSPAPSDYVAQIEFAGTPPDRVCAPCAELKFALRLTNCGRATWGASAEEGTPGMVWAGAHLLRADEEEVEWNFGGTGLPRDIAPGDSVQVDVVVRAPDEPGDYIIEFDMVAEQITWFEDRGFNLLRHPLSVC